MPPALSTGKPAEGGHTSATELTAATATMAKGYGHASPKAANLTTMPTRAMAVPETCEPDRVDRGQRRGEP